MRSHLRDFDLVSPADLPSALQLLSQGFRPIAGGTDLMVLLNAGRLLYPKLVSISKLTELSTISVAPDHVAIGAAVTYSAIQRHPVLRDEFPLLCRAANWTGGIANQNRGTIGGNIVNASPAADSPPALLVYDATIETISQAGGSRRIPYSQFHTGYKQMQLRPDELLSQIHLPRRGNLPSQYSRKVGARRAQAISKVCFSAVASTQNSVVRHVRIALGSVAPVPLRCHQTEAALQGERMTPSLIAHAREVIVSEIQPIDDIRSTAAYRSLVARNLLTEFLGGLL